jgi:hypothetical protein
MKDIEKTQNFVEKYHAKPPLGTQTGQEKIILNLTERN